MTLPSIVLGFICALLVGALFHLCMDGGLGRLMLYLTLSVLGFSAGQLVGGWRNWIFFPVGPLDLGMAILGSIVFLGIGYWLSLVELRRQIDSNDGV